ncbi:MAG: lysostaphin resistance A-like protein [Clostridiales bacterium]|nr:lysostaphin resistance A-like protein [Clostridiales bacterium]
MDTYRTNPYKTDQQWDGQYRKNQYHHKIDEYGDDSFWRIVRLLGIAALFVVIFSIVYFLFIGRINPGILSFTIAAGVALAVIISVKLVERKSMYAIGIGFRAVDLAFFFCGVLIGAAWGIVFVIVAALADEGFTAPDFIGMLLSPELPVLLAFPIPLAEELFFRGYALGNSFQQLKLWQRSLLVAGLFTIPQIIPNIEVSSATAILWLCAFTFLFGILLNMAAAFSKSIWMGFGLRWAFAFVFQPLFSATREYEFMLVVTMLLILGFMLIFWALMYMGRGSSARDGDEKSHEEDYDMEGFNYDTNHF